MASFRPGIAYWLTKAVRATGGTASEISSTLSVHKQCLYLALTNETVGLPLTQSVGPGFSMPPSVGYGLPAFEPLGPEALLLSEDPTALSDALADVVEDAWDRGFIKQDSMESDPVTFAGFGDPLLRLPALEAAAAAIKHRRHGAQLRVMTNGMVGASEALDVVQRLKGCGVKMLTVPLNAATPPSYAKMMSPPDGVGFQDVVNFVGVAAENGLSVECTAVSGVPKQPKSTPKKVEKVAMGCGATAFRLREWVPAAGE